MSRFLPLLALIPAALIWDSSDLAERIAGLEYRVEQLERKLGNHDKTYHFTCAPEDCLTVDELLKPLRRPMPQYDRRQKWLEDAYRFNKPNRCAGLCGGQAYWTGYECICPKGDIGGEN